MSEIKAALAVEHPPERVLKAREPVETLFVRLDRRLDRGLGAAHDAGVVREDLGAGRRLLILAELFDLVLADRQADLSFGDGRDLLRRDVTRPAEQACRHGKAVEDVIARVAHDLVDGPDLPTACVEDLPARLDQEPGDWIAAHTERPPTSQTGPCVPTGLVSESARRISTSPVMPASSQRLKQRVAISGATP